MNLTALEIKYTIFVLKAFEKLYPGEEVTVIPSGIKVTFWLTDRPDIYVKMEADLNSPFWIPAASPECIELLDEINSQKAEAHVA